MPLNQLFERALVSLEKTRQKCFIRIHARFRRRLAGPGCVGLQIKTSARLILFQSAGTWVSQGSLFCRSKTRLYDFKTRGKIFLNIEFPKISQTFSAGGFPCESPTI